MFCQALSADDIERIHQASLTVLADVGVRLHKSPEVVALLAENGCRTDGERAFFPPELVADCLQRVPDRESLTFGDPSLGYGRLFPLGRGQSHVTINGNAYTIYDYAAGRPRHCVESDSEAFSLIAAHLTNLVADPCDLVFHSQRTREGRRAEAAFDTAGARGAFLRRWLAGRQGIERPLGLNVRNYSAGEAALTTLALAIREGAAALEQRMAIWEQYIWFNPLSPLQWHPEQAPIFLELLDPARPCTLIIISPEVMLGTSCPVTIAGALAQHNAEVLAGVVLAQLVRPGVPTMYGFVGAATDLRTADISHGSIETALLNVAAVQMADRYGLPSRICPGNPSATSPGPRAAVETAMGLALGMAAGGNIIMTAILDSTLMLSYEHLLVTDEIVGQLHSANAGIRTDAESLAVDVITACAQQGGASFAFNPHTLANMKRDVYYSPFTGRIDASYEDWYAKAHRRVTEILAKAEDELVDAETIERLSAVEARLAEDDRAWRAGQDGWWRFYVQDFAES